MTTAIKLIIGLQNPGPAYEETRHNAGAWFVKSLATRHNLLFKTEKRFHTELASISKESLACKLMLPLTYMNHSGLAVREVVQFYRFHATELLIVHDDLDLAPGRLKLKSGGGHGGHNGLRDIILQLEQADFHRLRVGIGHPGHKDLVLNYVLNRPTLAEKELILSGIERALTVFPLIIGGEFQKAMTALNT